MRLNESDAAADCLLSFVRAAVVLLSHAAKHQNHQLVSQNHAAILAILAASHDVAFATCSTVAASLIHAANLHHAVMVKKAAKKVAKNQRRAPATLKAKLLLQNQLLLSNSQQTNATANQSLAANAARLFSCAVVNHRERVQRTHSTRFRNWTLQQGYP